MGRNNRRKDWGKQDTNAVWLQRGRGSCSTGKWQYLDRASAKKSGRFRGHKLGQYVCPECGFWHNGHLPEAVKRGDFTRDEWYFGVDDGEEFA